MVGAAHPGLGVAAVASIPAVSLVATIVAAALGDVNLTTDDGLDVALARLVKEIGGRKEVSVVGDGDSGHLLAGSFIQKLAGFTSSIEQTEIRMNVKVNELRLAHGTPF
jgi:hypothetical protein